MKKEIYFVTWLRTVAVLSILMCHFCAWSGNAFLVMCGQFFNIGVEIFFILSGFLFGIGGGQNKNPIQWFFKRIKRIYVPYELFLVVLLCVHLFLGYTINIAQWIRTALGIQGFNAVQGAEQAWFLTALLLCYFVTPMICAIIDQLVRKSIFVQFMFIGVLILIPFGLAFTDGEFIFVFLTPLTLYTLAYISGRYYQKIHISKRTGIIVSVVMCTMFVLRIVTRLFLDGSIFYDRIVVGYSQNIVAFCIFIIFWFLFDSKKPYPVVEKLSEISFEVYLYHCMFLVGPISLLNITRFRFLNCLIILVISLILAYAMNRFEKVITSKRIKGEFYDS